jgi:hypothetical protein
MLSKLLVSSVAVIGLLLAGPQKASADVIFACVNTTTGLLYVVSATTNCPPPTSGATWIKINWNATAGGQAPNVSWTPSLTATQPFFIICEATNVSAQARTINVELFNEDGVRVGQTGTALTQPENSILVGLGNPLGSRFHCKSTVTDGTSSDIRGSIQVCSSGPVVCNNGALAAQ